MAKENKLRWILRNLHDFGNCAVSFETYLTYDLQNALRTLYKDIKFRFVIDEITPGARTYHYRDDLVIITI